MGGGERGCFGFMFVRRIGSNCAKHRDDYVQ